MRSEKRENEKLIKMRNWENGQMSELEIEKTMVIIE